MSPRSKSQLAEWQRRNQRVLAADVVAGRKSGPSPPPEWAKTLRQLTQLARAPMPAPMWWTLRTALCGCVETRTDPSSYYFDGMNRPGPDDPPVFYFQLSIAGWGYFELYGEEPVKVTPGQGFFVIVPSEHRYYLPPSSPGWTFAWIGVHEPQLVARIARQVKATGPRVALRPNDALAGIFTRLVRAAIKKDFRDRFDAELSLWEFVLAFERGVHRAPDSSGEGQRLLDEIRSLIVARLPSLVGVDALAAEYGMSRSHFSQLFRSRTGLTPAHFVAEVRVHEAARMLRETREPLKIIASDCGFANANHFAKVFRRFQHLSPLSYRRTIRSG